MKKLLVVALMVATGVTFAQSRTGSTPQPPANPPGFQEIIKDRLPDLVRPDITCEGCSVEQIDDRAFPLDPRTSKVDIQQLGDNNEAYANQVGRNQGAYIMQDSNGKAVGNYAYVTQNDGAGGLAPAENQKAFIEQTGGNNAGIIDQRGDDQQAEQLVNGDNNNAYIQQGDLGSVNNKAKQTQTGDDNDARIVQVGGFGGGNRAIQSQVGNMNSAHIDQNGSENAAKQDQTGDHNFATAIQDGTGNVSLETQTTYAPTGGASGTVAPCNISTVNQQGDMNESCVTQDAYQYQNCSLVNQLGSNNNAEVTQTANLSNNASCVLQYGDMNKAVVSQTGN